jgi:uncharacterized membrane protein
MKAKIESSSAPDPEEPPKTRRIPRWVSIIAALVLIVGIVGAILFYGYQSRPGWVGVADKKFWDYLELLIVPAALAIGVYLLNRAQTEREREAEEAQRERERRAEEARRERELAVENQRAQDEALQAYLDQMSQLLTDKERPLHRAQLGDNLSTLARARTLTVLRRLDGERKGQVLEFLYESGLITRANAILVLSGADLSDAELLGVYLSGADLSEANLMGTLLNRADLSGASLLFADLSGASLLFADLSAANLSGADLSGATGGTEEQLTAAKNLKGATMPNGQKYEDWLKDKEGGGEDGKNSGPS